MPSDLLAYFNGDWTPYRQVRIPPGDRGFTKGDAVFDAARTFDGEAFELEAHVDRLMRSLAAVQLDPGLTAGDFLQLSREVVERNRQHLRELGDFQIHQFVTRGPGPWAHDAGPPNVCIKVAGVDFAKFAHLYADGVPLVVTGVQGYPNAALDPRIKHHSRMNFNLAELEAHRLEPGSWPVLIDANGAITEGTGYNVFAVRDGVICSPRDESVLEGISRTVVMRLARTLGIPFSERPLLPYDLAVADEAFVSGTSPCLLPVRSVNGRALPAEVPGGITRALLEAWSAEVGVDIAAQAREYAASDPRPGGRQR